MNGRLFLTILLLSLTISATAQRRQLQEARVILKGDKDYDKAEKLMTDLLQDSANLANTRIYDMWLQAVEKQYMQVNERMYKKEEVDTTNFFALTRRMFDIGLRLDSLDMMPDKKGRVNPEYRKDNAQKLMQYRPNLFYGGTYHLRKGELETAYDFFERYMDCDRQPLFTGYDLMENDGRMGEAAYWATYCGYRMGDPVLTLRYATLARRDTAKLENTLQLTAEAWRQLKDMESFATTLREGFDRYPNSAYFFPRLMDGYSAKGDYEKALAVAEKALAADSLNTLYMLAKSTMLLNLGRYEECVDYSQKLIAFDGLATEAFYNAGTACMNIALRMDSRKQKKQITKMYQKALPYMETYRKLAPQETQKWGEALYRIYFNLNMGKQFEEIDKILKK
jgi:tetratricopeptide (TPR) repeat protein